MHNKRSAVNGAYLYLIEKLIWNENVGGFVE